MHEWMCGEKRVRGEIGRNVPLTAAVLNTNFKSMSKIQGVNLVSLPCVSLTTAYWCFQMTCVWDESLQVGSGTLVL